MCILCQVAKERTDGHVAIWVQAVKLLQDNGMAEGLGRLYSNLAASYLQMDRPYAAVAACNSALQARTVSALLLGPSSCST